MATEENLRFGRNDSTLVTKYPDPFHVINDVSIPGKSDKFVRDLRAALDTRGLLRYILEREVSIVELADANAGATAQQIATTYDNYTSSRQSAMRSAAAVLPSLLAGLTQAEMRDLDRMVAENDACGLFESVMNYVDTSEGRAQDIIRAKYAAIAISPSDSIAKVVQSIDLKWYLFQKHTLFDNGTDAGQREGVRQLMQMLSSGPHLVATSASLSLTQIDTMVFPTDGADGYVRNLIQTYTRYQANFAGSSSGGLHATFPGGGELYKWACNTCWILNCKEKNNPDKMCVVLSDAEIDERRYPKTLVEAERKKRVDAPPYSRGDKPPFSMNRIYKRPNGFFALSRGSGGKGKGNGRGSRNGGRGNSGTGFGAWMLGGSIEDEVHDWVQSADPRDSEDAAMLGGSLNSMSFSSGTNFMIAGFPGAATPAPNQNQPATRTVRKYAGTQNPTVPRIRTQDAAPDGIGATPAPTRAAQVAAAIQAAGGTPPPLDGGAGALTPAQTLGNVVQAQSPTRTPNSAFEQFKTSLLILLMALIAGYVVATVDIKSAISRAPSSYSAPLGTTPELATLHLSLIHI